MIKVKKGQDDTTQKVINSFLKRVKKFNLIARVRKSKFKTKPASQSKKRAKKLAQVQYLKEAAQNRVNKL